MMELFLSIVVEGIVECEMIDIFIGVGKECINCEIDFVS